MGVVEVEDVMDIKETSDVVVLAHTDQRIFQWRTFINAVMKHGKFIDKRSNWQLFLKDLLRVYG